VKILSVNVGRPQIVLRDGEPVSTAIFKQPVDGRIPVRKLNLDGDRQADLTVHGGPYKAVYVYPVEHYDFWRAELPGMDLPWGMFGENFTTEGLNELTTNIGDTFRMGTALVMVTQPRMPCYKLGIRFGRTDIIKRFLISGRSGFYLSVLEEGEVGTGDSIELVTTAADSVRVWDIVRLYFAEKSNAELLRRAIAVEALPESWRTYFQKKLDKLESGEGADDDKEKDDLS
jgi:MOSC domain-containing protein YiiM